jgi:hypothetical protein
LESLLSVDFVPTQDTPEDMPESQTTLVGFSRTVMLKTGNVLIYEFLQKYDNNNLHVFLILSVLCTVFVKLLLCKSDFKLG